MDPFRELCKLTTQAIVKYQMIAAGDRILVGLSGGKDSFALLHVLHELARRSPVKFELIAATFDPGYPGFNASGIAAYCRARNWPHEQIALPIAPILAEKKFTDAPCVLCSRLRRGKLYGLAAQLGCRKLALGQHFDDIAASFLMSFCRGQGLTTMGPNVPTNSTEKLRIIRPFAMVPESLIVECTGRWELPEAGKCHYENRLAAGDRAAFRRLIDDLAERIPNLRSQMLRSLSNLQPGYLLDPRYLVPDDFDGKVTDNPSFEPQTGEDPG